MTFGEEANFPRMGESAGDKGRAGRDGRCGVFGPFSFPFNLLDDKDKFIEPNPSKS